MLNAAGSLTAVSPSCPTMHATPIESSSNIAQDADTELVLSLINEPTSTGNLFLPGISADSTAMLVEKLKHNYLHNDAFFQVRYYSDGIIHDL